MDRKNINRGFKKSPSLASGPEGSAYAPEGKMLFPSMSWPVKYLPTFHSN